MKDPHFQYIQKVILKSPQRLQLLNLYQKVYQGKRVADDSNSIIQNQLKLSGLLKAENEYLQIGNHIYRRVFNLEWVRRNNDTSDYSNFFRAGGMLPPDTSCYLKRTADDELLSLVLAGTFCYVLTPPQMGKSSLMIRTADRLKRQAISTAILDVSGIGTVTTEQWYLSLLTQLKRELGLTVNPIAWWEARRQLSHVQRFTDFVRLVILAEVKTKLVIFIDEIQILLALELRDDFFAAIRAMYNARADDPEFNRLIFVLLGIASPSDLIEDPTRTPFNVGQSIALSEFSQAEASLLQDAVEAICPGQGEALFTRIYHWTNGHPYLTQQLCLAIASNDEKRWAEQQVDALVEELFLSQATGKKNNFQFVANKILHNPQRAQLLELYQKVYKGEKIADEGQSNLHHQLKLSGLVNVENGYLQVRNHLYRRVFDLAWVKKNAPASNSDFMVANGLPSRPSLPISALRSGICPFEYGPTVPPERFYGRDSQRVRIKNRIGGISAQSVSIVGMRRSGKSSLLRYIRERLAEFCSPEQQALVVTLNLQAKRFQRPEGLIEGLRRGIERHLGRSPWQRHENHDEFAVEDGLRELRDAGKRLIVLIDEFESISKHLEQFRGWGDDWRTKASEGYFALVIATLRPLDEIYEANGLTSSFANLFTRTDMQPFSKQEWGTLVRERFTMSGIQIRRGDLALIDDLAGGWPFYTQMAAALLWEYGDHIRTRKAFKQQATPRFAELWHDLKESERQVLHHIVKPNKRLSSDTALIGTLQRHGIVRSDGKPFSSAFAEFVRLRRISMHEEG